MFKSQIAFDATFSRFILGQEVDKRFTIDGLSSYEIPDQSDMEQHEMEQVLFELLKVSTKQ